MGLGRRRPVRVRRHLVQAGSAQRAPAREAVGAVDRLRLGPGRLRSRRWRSTSKGSTSGPGRRWSTSTPGPLGPLDRLGRAPHALGRLHADDGPRASGRQVSRGPDPVESSVPISKKGKGGGKGSGAGGGAGKLEDGTVQRRRPAPVGPWVGRRATGPLLRRPEQLGVRQRGRPQRSRTGRTCYAAFDGVIGPAFGYLGDPKDQGRFAGKRLHLVGRHNELYYAHLSLTAHGIGPGKRVKAGDLLGWSGQANGVEHLHLGERNGYTGGSGSGHPYPEQVVHRPPLGRRHAGATTRGRHDPPNGPAARQLPLARLGQRSRASRSRTSGPSQSRSACTRRWGRCRSSTPRTRRSATLC